MLCSSTFLSLDGVMSDPHIWHPACASDESLALLGEQTDAADALLLGRRTYDGFASYWPDQGDEVPLARRTNEIAKHVEHRAFALSLLGTRGGRVTEIANLLPDQLPSFGLPMPFTAPG